MGQVKVCVTSGLGVQLGLFGGSSRVQRFKAGVRAGQGSRVKGLPMCCIVHLSDSSEEDLAGR